MTKKQMIDAICNINLNGFQIVEIWTKGDGMSGAPALHILDEEELCELYSTDSMVLYDRYSITGFNVLQPQDIKDLWVNNEVLTQQDYWYYTEKQYSYRLVIEDFISHYKLLPNSYLKG